MVAASPERDEVRNDSAELRASSNGGFENTSSEQKAPATTLVEISPGIAVVYGEVPEGMELHSLDLIPSFDRTALNSAIGAFGSVGSVVGNLSEAAAAAQGLFRASSETMALLNSGAQMAVKDGAKIGAIFKNGQIVAQARFVPVTMSAATAIATIGPAVAMIALQMQLGEISGLVKANIAVTTQTMKAIRNEQWAELDALTETISDSVDHVRDIKAVPDSLWEAIAPSYSDLKKQMNLYQRNVSGHIREVGVLMGRERRQYLETNAEAVVFDAYALLTSLKAYAEYQSVKAMRARIRGQNDEAEAQLFERLTRDVPEEIQTSRHQGTALIKSLVRELRIIAELPGRRTLPLTKTRKDSKASQLTCAQLLEAIEPLANMVLPPTEMPQTPGNVCAPEELDLTPYLKMLRWLMEEGEVLQGLAFPYVGGSKPMIPAILEKRIDASWDSLLPGKAAAVLDKIASSTFVAVTDKRVLTASPRTLLKEGALAESFALEEIRYVRPRGQSESAVRPTIGIATEKKDITWMFPASAPEQQIDALAAMLDEEALRKPSGGSLSEPVSSDRKELTE